jgi:hypothetical protein
MTSLSSVRVFEFTEFSLERMDNAVGYSDNAF